MSKELVLETTYNLILSIFNFYNEMKYYWLID